MRMRVQGGHSIVQVGARGSALLKGPLHGRGPCKGLRGEGESGCRWEGAGTHVRARAGDNYLVVSVCMCI